MKKKILFPYMLNFGQKDVIVSRLKGYVHLISNFDLSCLEFLLQFKLIWNFVKLVLLKGLFFFSVTKTAEFLSYFVCEACGFLVGYI